MLDLSLHYLIIERDFAKIYGLKATHHIREFYCTNILNPPRLYKGDNKTLLWKHAQLQHEPALSIIREYEKNNRERH